MLVEQVSVHRLHSHACFQVFVFEELQGVPHQPPAHTAQQASRRHSIDRHERLLTTTNLAQPQLRCGTRGWLGTERFNHVQ